MKQKDSEKKLKYLCWAPIGASKLSLKYIEYSLILKIYKNIIILITIRELIYNISLKSFAPIILIKIMKIDTLLVTP